MTYCLRENLIVMLLWPLHVVVSGFCLFVCFILNSPCRFLCLARLFSFKTHLCSNGFQHGLRAILSQHPASVSIFAISLLCRTDLHTQFYVSGAIKGVWHMVVVLYIFCGGTRNTLVLTVVVALQLPSHIQLFGALWIAADLASLFLTISQNLPKFMSIESVMPPNHPIFHCPLLLLPSIFPNIRVFSNELTTDCIKRPKYWSFSFWQCTGL